MVDVTKCPFFETIGDGHETEYFERCLLKCSGYEPLCEDNEKCFYRRGNAKDEVLDLCEEYFAPTLEYDFMHNEWVKYDRKIQPVLDGYVKTIQTIINTLGEME